MKVLVLAAHADDEVLGAGGAIARHFAAGDTVLLFVAADCRSARDPDARPALLPAANDAADVLRRHAKGAAVGFLGFAAMTLYASEQSLNAKVSGLVRAIEPDIVYTHHWADVNSDHRACFRAVEVAMRPAGRAQRILCFEVPSSTEWAIGGEGFRPNYFVDITETIDAKLAAMTCYAEELRLDPHPRNIDALRARARYWGQAAGCLYAEAFVLGREVVK